MANPQSDTVLIELILKGNKKAFEELFDRYHTYVYTLAMKFSGNNIELSEEITQDSLLKAFQHLRGFENKSKFSTWLYRIVFSTAMDATKSSKKAVILKYVETLEDDLEDDALREGCETKFEKGFLDREINEALSKLSPIDSIIITLFYLNGETIDSIGSILKIDKNTIKVKLFRARQKLKQLLSARTKSPT